MGVRLHLGDKAQMALEKTECFIGWSNDITLHGDRLPAVNEKLQGRSRVTASFREIVKSHKDDGLFARWFPCGNLILSLQNLTSLIETPCNMARLTIFVCQDCVCTSVTMFKAGSCVKNMNRITKVDNILRFNRKLVTLSGTIFRYGEDRTWFGAVAFAPLP